MFIVSIIAFIIVVPHEVQPIGEIYQEDLQIGTSDLTRLVVKTKWLSEDSVQEIRSKQLICFNVEEK